MAFEAVWIYRVDKRDRMLLADQAGQAERVIEITAHVEDAGAVGDGLRELAPGDVAMRHEDVGIEPAPGGVGGC